MFVDMGIRRDFKMGIQKIIGKNLRKGLKSFCYISSLFRH